MRPRAIPSKAGWRASSAGWRRWLRRCSRPHRTRRGRAPNPHLRTELAMAVERSPGGSSLIDVLDRVLDRGIVGDAWVRVSLVGTRLAAVAAGIALASIDTYLKYSEAVGLTASGSRPRELAGSR